MDEQRADEAAPIINITGERVLLGPLRRELLPLYTRWMNDYEVIRTLGVTVRPTTREAEQDWYEQNARALHSVDFTIYEAATGRPIGNTSLKEVNYARRTATFGILIGEPDCWGKGYGTEVTRLMLDYGFTVLGLHNIMLIVFSFNERGYRAYLRAGFREIGRRREAFRLGGRAYDEILMDCLATEFESPVLHRLLP
jgi:RimJ/RimL family protein N-acetyltransferase